MGLSAQPCGSRTSLGSQCSPGRQRDQPYNSGCSSCCWRDFAKAVWHLAKIPAPASPPGAEKGILALAGSIKVPHRGISCTSLNLPYQGWLMVALHLPCSVMDTFCDWHVLPYLGIGL